MSNKKVLLASLPAVDDLLKSSFGKEWLAGYPRRLVVRAIREVIASRRHEVIAGHAPCLSPEDIALEVTDRIECLAQYSLRPVINATGIVLHTNLGRSILSERVLHNVSTVGTGYTNLEYDVESGLRGKRHVHTQALLTEITGAEDAVIVNNNAAAVCLALNTVAKGREVVVSRGELVEIGGSFRIPDVMAASSAILKEVGTTNKTHLYDYSGAINDQTGLLLKVHQSNYKMIGFTEEVSINEIVALGKTHQLPVMHDLGSGSLMDLKRFGIHSEPSVRDIVESGVDIVTFSGDKLLGGPQGGIIVGKKEYLEKMRKNPLARAFRIDKFTIAAFEATLMEYLDPVKAIENIPVLSLLFQSPEEIKARAKKIAAAISRQIPDESVRIIPDRSQAGGGSLPGVDFPTFAVSLQPASLTVNDLEERLRKSSPPVVARIKDKALLLDARTIRTEEMASVVNAVVSSLKQR